MKIVLYPNFSKEKALPLTLSLCDFLNRRDVEVFVDEAYIELFSNVEFVSFGEISEIISNCDFVIAVGGDGTILKASHFASFYDKPLLGINTGRLGFMASVESNEMQSISKLLSAEFVVEKRMMIDAVLYRNNEIFEEHSALNDIVVSTPYAKISDYNVSTDGKNVSTVRADGIVFSTPTGSTAYALSAGGPIIEPCLECIQMTPICPHSLFARTMLFSSDRELEVEYTSKNNAEMYFAVDGHHEVKLENNDRLVIRKSKKVLKLIDIKGNNFFDAVNNKLMKSIK